MHPLRTELDRSSEGFAGSPMTSQRASVLYSRALDKRTRSEDLIYLSYGSCTDGSLGYGGQGGVGCNTSSCYNGGSGGGDPGRS